MPTYSVITFGCQMNQHDSERIGEVLGAAGYVPAGQPNDADTLVLNTCSVREKAEQKLRSEVGRLRALKRVRPELVIVVAGCVAQQEGEALLRRMPELDLVIGPDNIGELPELLGELDRGGLPRARTEFDLDAPRFLRALPQPNAGSGVTPTAFVTIMKGCDERCSFCIVPHTRGPERYRSSREIVEEVARLVEAGVREVTLLGQTVNSYRDPMRALPPAPGHGERPFGRARRALAAAEDSEFPALLRAIAEQVPGLLRLRYTSPHPRHLSLALIRAHLELAVLARHVHLPVQSGSDRVLKRMLRRYSVSEYLERTAALTEMVPGVTLSTDVIVGFPGETPDDFEATLELVERVKFTGLFGFKYSERPYTPARRLADDVSEPDKASRLARLFELSGRLRRRHLESLIGRTAHVLVEGPNRKGGYTGRSERNEIVHFRAGSDATGEIVPVTISAAYDNSLAAEPLSEALRLPHHGTLRHDPRPEPPLPEPSLPQAPGARRALPVLLS